MFFIKANCFILIIALTRSISSVSVITTINCSKHQLTSWGLIWNSQSSELKESSCILLLFLFFLWCWFAFHHLRFCFLCNRPILQSLLFFWIAYWVSKIFIEDTQCPKKKVSWNWLNLSINGKHGYYWCPKLVPLVRGDLYRLFSYIRLKVGDGKPFFIFREVHWMKHHKTGSHITFFFSGGFNARVTLLLKSVVNRNHKFITSNVEGIFHFTLLCLYF